MVALVSRDLSGSVICGGYDFVCRLFMVYQGFFSLL